MAYNTESRIDQIIEHPATAKLIATFFDEGSAFEGNLLERIGTNDPLAITTDDLLAITMLDVQVKPRGVRRLIFDASVSSEISSLLAQIPSDVDIWNGRELLASGGKTWELWTLLQRSGHGIMAVTAGKLLSRKRPRLVPILDRVVEKIIAVNKSDQWDFFVSYLSDSQRRNRLASLLPSDLNPVVSTLRLLDVSLWMWGSEGRSAKKARQEAGLGDSERNTIMSE